MTDYPTAVLSELCENGRTICYGIVQPGTHMADGVPIVRVNNFRTNHLDLTEVMRVDPAIDQKFKRSRPKPHDVLISLVGTLGQVAIAPPDIGGWNLARAVGLIPTNDRHKAQWVFFTLQSPEAQQFIRSHANTTVQATFNLGDLANLSIPYPDRSEREAILSILSSLDEKIELNRRMNETLEALAQAIFKDWFVDFGPTRRKALGETNPVAILGNLIPNPEKSQKTAALFPNSFGDDGMPDGWKASSLGKHVVNFDSKRVPVSGGERAKRKGVYPYHGATGVMDHIDNYLFDGVYLLVGEDGSVVKESGLAFTQYVWGKIWVNNHAHVLQGKDGVSTEQLLLYFKQEQVEPFITGAVQLKLSQGRMNAMPFVDAGFDVFSKFYETVAPLFSRIRSSVDESRTLAETRDYLLPKLMSGEVRVRDAEKMVEGVGA